MPLPLISISISIDDYHVMAHRIGWKHEYWDSHAQLSPSQTAIAYFQREIWPKLPDDKPKCQLARGTMRCPEPDDAAELIRLHCAVFDDAIEYAGHDEASYRRSITESIEAFLGGSIRRSFAVGHLAYSRVVEDRGQVIAAMLVRKDRDDGFVVQPVMVDQAWRQAGIAKQMLDEVCLTLASDDHPTLNSRCHLGNTASIAWHRSVGFEEQPTSFAASHRSHHHGWMARHHQAAGRQLEAHYHRELAEAYALLKFACEKFEFEKFRRV